MERNIRQEIQFLTNNRVRLLNYLDTHNGFPNDKLGAKFTKIFTKLHSLRFAWIDDCSPPNQRMVQTILTPKDFDIHLDKIVSVMDKLEVTPGTRTFFCEYCSKDFSLYTRDFQTPSGEDCPICQKFCQPDSTIPDLDYVGRQL